MRCQKRELFISIINARYQFAQAQLRAQSCGCPLISQYRPFRYCGHPFYLWYDYLNLSLTQSTQQQLSMIHVWVKKYGVCYYIFDHSKRYITSDKPQTLAKKQRYILNMNREAIEIKEHSDFNREYGWMLPSTWGPILNKIKF